ncbi:hypothetical protein [Nannocystis radixulma]|nr:hypothetical protein [Nannocystis radixulma]
MNIATMSLRPDMPTDVAAVPHEVWLQRPNLLELSITEIREPSPQGFILAAAVVTDEHERELGGVSPSPPDQPGIYILAVDVVVIEEALQAEQTWIRLGLQPTLPGAALPGEVVVALSLVVS